MTRTPSQVWAGDGAEQRGWFLSAGCTPLVRRADLRGRLLHPRDEARARIVLRHWPHAVHDAFVNDAGGERWLAAHPSLLVPMVAALVLYRRQLRAAARTGRIGELTAGAEGRCRCVPYPLPLGCASVKELRYDRPPNPRTEWAHAHQRVSESSLGHHDVGIRPTTSLAPGRWPGTPSHTTRGPRRLLSATRGRTA